jgi:hypothetical protein
VANNDFKCFLPLKIQRIPKNQVLEGKSVEDMVTLGPRTHTTLVINDSQVKLFS